MPTCLRCGKNFPLTHAMITVSVSVFCDGTVRDFQSHPSHTYVQLRTIYCPACGDVLWDSDSEKGLYRYTFVMQENETTESILNSGELKDKIKNFIHHKIGTEEQNGK